ncbi:hypothetical protein CMI47_10140 [Candidatus Pacearchaeota archaeon]|nr:hypothetical protein [Candidatus Pacearchaeota archaeon]
MTNDTVADTALTFWDERQPGQGETTLDRKVVVPVPAIGFVCTTVLITEQMKNAWINPIRSVIRQREEGEDLFIGNELRPWAAKLQGIKIEPEPCNFAKVVCYSAEALLENGGERTTTDDWEIVCIIASPVENEPMSPLAMARNMLRKTGGTMGTYTAAQFAESVYYWSQRIRI